MTESGSTVPLVAYENGERKIIGDVVVYSDGRGLTAYGHITDSKYISIVAGGPLELSIGPYTVKEKRHNGR